jgi:HEAT repeat protein
MGLHLLFTINPFSFWLGFILASLLWWVVLALRPLLRQTQQNVRGRVDNPRKSRRSSATFETRYRQMVLQQAQGMHLAAPLFMLDEVLHPPLLVAPPPRVEPGAPIQLEDIVSSTLPFLPAWPELGSIYKAPTLSLSEALSGNSDIVLTGQTGMGKTVALASLASQLARKDGVPGLSDSNLPFLMHAADLDPVVKKDNPLNPLIDRITTRVALLDASKVSAFIHRAFEEGNALLLLDGTDELSPEGLKNAVEFIRAIKRAYPKTRMVTTASSECLDGLVSLNFIPFALAAWTLEQRLQFCEKWADLWKRYVSVEAWAQSGREQIDPLLLNSWLKVDIGMLTPLELTLKVWGAYAGDLRGSRPVDFIETHLRRMTPSNSPREALELLAMQVHLLAQPVFEPRTARDWIKSFEPAESSVDPTSLGLKKDTKRDKGSKPVAAPMGLVSRWIESGLLVQQRNNRIRFCHPIFSGYLAGKKLVSFPGESILDQPPWTGKYLALHYLAILGDASSMVGRMIAHIERPTAQSLLIPARWLREAPSEAAWRGPVLAKLADLVQQEGQPLGLRGQALAALVLSGDPAAVVLFRQMLTENNPGTLQLGALGCGAVQDSKSIELLSKALNTPLPAVRRACCLALVAIGTREAMDVVGSALLHGDDNLRRSAAEAMADNPVDGLVMLKEAVGMKNDLDLRRAAVYGLGRLHQPWSDALLTKLQLEDDQWIVRNAAVEVLEERQHGNPYIPMRLPVPTQSPWVIAYASKQGIGVSPDKPVTDLLLNILKNGNEEERLATLNYLRIVPIEGVFGALYQAMYGGNTIIREAAYQVIAEMAARGIEIPDPVQFGVGQ